MNSIDQKNSAISILTEFLDSHNMRRTPERFAILEKVMDLTGHFSVEILQKQFETEGYHISRSTLYNTVRLFQQCGILRRVRISSTESAYEKVVNPVRHYHLICSQCGKVREVKDQMLERMISTLRFGKFVPTFVDMNVYGLCATCKRISARIQDAPKSRKKKKQSRKPSVK